MGHGASVRPQWTCASCASTRPIGAIFLSLWRGKQSSSGCRTGVKTRMRAVRSTATRRAAAQRASLATRISGQLGTRPSYSPAHAWRSAFRAAKVLLLGAITLSSNLATCTCQPRRSQCASAATTCWLGRIAPSTRHIGATSSRPMAPSSGQLARGGTAEGAGRSLMGWLTFGRRSILY